MTLVPTIKSKVVAIDIDYKFLTRNYSAVINCYTFQVIAHARHYYKLNCANETIKKFFLSKFSCIYLTLIILTKCIYMFVFAPRYCP